jgi:hypothetical protein
MGVDGIGSSGGSGPIDPSLGVGRPSADFAVEHTDAAQASDLDRVASGELSVDAYLDARVREATTHLAGALDPEQLATLQEQLREQLRTDPLLARLVHRALGSTPSEPSR